MDSAPEPQQALAALAQAVDLLAQSDLGVLSDRELLEHTVGMERQLTRLQAQRARALRAVDARQAYKEDACVTTASWWRWRTRRDYDHATQVVRTALRLGWLDDTRQALEDGEIGHAHAAVIARAAIPRRRDAIVAHEAGLVTLAQQATPKQVAIACRRIADLVDPDGTDAPASGPDARRELYHAPTFAGLWDLRATLDTLTGERLHHLLTALATPDPPDLPEEQRRSPAQVRHDAFDAVLRAAEEHPDLPAVHGATPHVLLTIDLTTLAGHPPLAQLGGDDGPSPAANNGATTTDDDPSRAGSDAATTDDAASDGARPYCEPDGLALPAVRGARLGSGARLDLRRALELLEGSKLTPVLMAGPWRAVAVGRTHRTLPSWLRPLLASIHGHCRGPGCDRPTAWSDAAHLDAWQHGGRTDLDRTIPACRPHHRLMDETGWQVDLDPNTATCTWTSPDRQTVIRTHPPP